MFVWSWRIPKLGKKWLMVGAFVLVAGVVLTILLVNGGGTQTEPGTEPVATPSAAPEATQVETATQVAQGEKIETLEARLSYLKQYGWLVDLDAEVERTVTIPDTFDEVYTAFNNRQRAQGMDLAPYAGKTVTSFTYPVLNYPDQELTVFVELLVRDGKVIGGEVYGTAPTSFEHGLMYQAPEERTETAV